MSPSPVNMSSRDRARDRRHGDVLTLLSAVAFSTAGFFTRAVPVDPWAMILWRGVFGAGALALILCVARPTVGGSHFRPGRREWGIVGLFAVGTICFVSAFAWTSVAHVAVIYATAPMVAAGLAWLWRREAPPRRTVAMAGLAVVGVCITVADSSGSGGLIGDALTFAMTISVSLAAILARGTPLPVLPLALMSSSLAAVAVLPLGWLAGARLIVGCGEMAWLASFGIVTMTVALPCYLAGASRLPAARTMLISALELPLAPLWVWLAFGEAPTGATLVGGAIVVTAVLGDLAAAPD